MRIVSRRHFLEMRSNQAECFLHECQSKLLIFTWHGVSGCMTAGDDALVVKLFRDVSCLEVGGW
jgi:hypothetical protein